MRRASDSLPFISLLLCLLQVVWSANVQVAVYYEALCGDSRNFVTGQLWDTHQQIGHIMDLDMVPYGKATERKLANGTWAFTCHFGVNECKANLIQTCALNLYWETDKDQVLAFLKCMEENRQPHNAGSTCATKTGLDYSPVRECTTSPQGNQWQHEMATKTQALNPPLNFVPWVTIDGVHDEELHSEYLNDFKGLVCKAYQGERPLPCYD